MSEILRLHLIRVINRFWRDNIQELEARARDDREAYELLSSLRFIRDMLNG